MNTNLLKPLAIGTALALLTIAFALFLPLSWQRAWFSLLLAAIAAIYVGFALNDGRPAMLTIESTNALVFLGVALLGSSHSIYWLIGGYIAHGLWDLLHRPGGIPTTIARGYPPFCLIYDWIIAAYLIWRWF